MTKPFEIKLTTVSLAQNLPDHLAAQIGHVISTWARIERVLNVTIYNMAGIDATKGRLIIGTARASDQLKKIVGLMTVMNLSVDRDLGPMQKRLENLEGERDAIAHGHWVEQPDGTYLLEYFRGKWNTQRKDLKVSRRMYPVAMKIDFDGLLRRINNDLTTLRSLNDAFLRHTSQGKQP